MKKSLLLFLVALSVTFTQAQLVEMQMDLVAEHDGPYPNADGSEFDLTGFKTYRLYAVVTNPTDFVVAVLGQQDYPLVISTTTSFFHNPFGSTRGSQINPNFYPFSSSLIYDSWVTIGLDNNQDPGEPVSSVGEAWIQQFADGGDIVMDDIFGGSWFILPNPGDQPVNGLPDGDLRVLIGQFTTDGDIVGYVNVQVFPESNQNNSFVHEGFAFTSIEGAVLGCNEPEAENYNPDATVNDGSCVFPCTLSAQLNITQPACHNSTNGSLVVVPSGAQSGATYQLNQGNILANPNFNNLAVGSYTMTVRDGVGCEVVYTFSIVGPAQVVVSATVTQQVTCNGAGNAIISGSGAGGTGALEFSLNAQFNPSTDELFFNNLAPGTYVVYARDANNCTSQSGNISVTQPPSISGGVTGTPSPATCADLANGVIVVQFFGGAGGFTYSLDGENFAPGNVINATPGTYTVYAMDANGCIAQTNNQAVVGGPAPITLTTQVVNPSCAGDANGAFSGLASGGNGVFVYVVNEGDQLSMLDLEELEAGVYAIEVVDGNGCTGDFDVIIVEPDAVSIEVISDDVLCFGESTGSLVITGDGGTGAFEYTLDGGDASATGSFENLGAGTYLVGAFDANGCEAQADVSITQPTALGINGTSTEESAPGAANGSASVTVNGGTPPYTYSWTGPNNFTGTTASISGISGGSYSVLVTDANGCTIEFTTEVLVSVGEVGNAVQFTVYPNPSNAVFYLALEGLNGERVHYTIVDGAGRIIDRKELNAGGANVREAIDMTYVASGFYLLQLTVGDSTRSIRLMKQN